jgi:hypothetical protein
LPRAPTESIAYVFYHRPARGVRRATYERALLSFHDQLARSPTPGFRGSAALRLPHVTWGAARRRPLYVDWYVLGGFGDLGPVRDVAYRPPWVESHRRIAGLFGDGEGGLFAARGTVDPPTAPDLAVWFSSPEGRGKSLLRRWWTEGPPRGTLWRRQLAVGPSPEFCFFGPGPVPPALAPRSAHLSPDYLLVPRRARTTPR